MSVLKKEYKQPKCPTCDIDLLYQEVYLKGRTYKIKSDGVPDNFNLTPNIPEVLEFKQLVCSRCNQSFDIKYDNKNRINRGPKA